MIKKTLFLCYFLLVSSFALPLIFTGLLCEEKSPPPSDGQALAVSDTLHQVKVLHQGSIISMNLFEYLTGVTAAEMPASFPLEALKAQAVAARSYTAYQLTTQRHAQAQICTDPGCCQAWMSTDVLRERWGTDYPRYRQRVERAVRETDGQHLQYQGQPVLAAFHSSSPGTTEDSSQIWSAVPYLVSVSSPETPETLPQMLSQLRVAPLDFRDTILSSYPAAQLDGDPSLWLGDISHTTGGRVASVLVGGQAVSGVMLRQLFSLRSTAFSLAYEADEYVFIVAGFGHGVGMSQYGAKIMADQGAGYAEILAHYYPGTKLVS